MEMASERCKLVSFLESSGYIRSKQVKEATLAVERENFVPDEYSHLSYVDRPLPIGESQTISAPSMISIMLEVSDLKEGQKVLEIGTGSGYNACLLAHIVGDGLVTTIERISPLYIKAKENLKKCNRSINLYCGDGTLGWEKNSPYNRIMITAAAPNFPEPLIEQLTIGGKIIAPVGRHATVQKLEVGTKLPNGELNIESYGYCVFVPLIGKYGF